MADESGIRTRSPVSDRNCLIGDEPHLQRFLALEDQIFTGLRVRSYAILIVVALGAVLCWGFGHGRWLFLPDGKLGSIDFCWIWFSGKFAAISDPSRIYDQAWYEAAYRHYYHPGECHLLLEQYIYPPTFLFLTYLLGLLPYLVAFAVWMAATLLLYLAAVYLILPGWTTLIVALTPFAVLSNITLGHNGFLTAGLIGLSLVFFERRPWLAGILLGLLAYKPQFGLLYPLALLASRNWRALGSATATGLTFGVTAAIAFGHQTWPAFIASLFDRTAGLSPQAGVELLLGSVYGLLHRAGTSAWFAWTGQLVAALSLALAVFAVWARPIPYALKAALLCVGSLLATPYLLGYDLCSLSIAAAFLVSDGLSRGFLVGERTTLLACLLVLYFPVASLAPVIFAGILYLIFRRILAPAGNFPRPSPSPSPGCRSSPFADHLIAGSR
jgi:Glycosyltransferase family 87